MLFDARLIRLSHLQTGTWSVRNAAIGVVCTSTSDSDDPTSIDVTMWQCECSTDETVGGRGGQEVMMILHADAVVI